jgi:hypothetical protein
VPLHDQKIGVWCAITASWIVGPIFFLKTLLIHSGMSVTFYGPFSGALRKKKRHTVIYARRCYSTHCHLFHKCFERSVWKQSDKSRIVACKIPRLKSLWFFICGEI